VHLVDDVCYTAVMGRAGSALAGLAAGALHNPVDRGDGEFQAGGDNDCTVMLSKLAEKTIDTVIDELGPAPEPCLPSAGKR